MYGFLLPASPSLRSPATRRFQGPNWLRLHWQGPQAFRILHAAFTRTHTHTHTQATVAVAAAYYGARILQLQLPSSSSSSSPSSSLLSLCCEVRLKWALLGCTDCNAAAAAAVAVAVASSVVQIATIACAPSRHRCDQQHSHSQLD